MPVWDRAYRSRAWESWRSEVVDIAYRLATEWYRNRYWAAFTMNTDSREWQHEVKVSKADGDQFSEWKRYLSHQLACLYRALANPTTQVPPRFWPCPIQGVRITSIDSERMAQGTEGSK